MKTFVVLGLALLLAACANAPPPAPPPDGLFHDALFAAPSAPIDGDAALAFTPEMRRYVSTHFRTRVGLEDRKRELVDALYNRSDLRLEYDASMTRTASQAFEARSGNCLALVLMTAAFAKELGLAVHYQSVLGEETWDRADALYITAGHVNLSLEDRWIGRAQSAVVRDGALIVDFLPSRTAQTLRTREIGEPTVIAMYLTNRAVESLTHGQLDDAYWFARAAVKRDPQMASGYIALGVVYRLSRHPELAEAVLERVSEREPDNVYAMSNRVLTLRDLGRGSEADALVRRLAQIDPHPPYSYFHQGMAALEQGRYEEARKLFAKEVERAPYNHEFEFWLAVSYLDLHDFDRARQHLTRAMEVSATRKDHDLYAAKLDRLKALRAQ